MAAAPLIRQTAARTARTAQPLTALSRSNLVLPVGFATNSGTLMTWERIFLNPQDGLYYATYGTIPASKLGLASAPSPDGPWTDLGSPSGLPGNGSAQQHFVMLGPDNKWAWYSVTSIVSHVGTIQLSQTAAGAPITGPYTVTNSALLALGATTTDWDYGRISEPFVFQTSTSTALGPAGTWVLLYMGFNNGLTVEQIGLATSSGDYTGPWTKYAGNPVVPAGASGFDQGANADPFCIYYNGLYYIFTAPGPVNAPQGANVLSLALTTTPDFTTFTKRGIVLPTPATPGVADRYGAWGGKFWWKGLRADDTTFVLPTSADTIYWTHFGQNLPQGATGVLKQGMLDKLDAQSIFGGAILASPWTRVESTAADSHLNRTGTWTVVSSGNNRGFSGGSYVYSNTTGSQQTLTWTGRRARVFVGNQANQGIMTVTLDGVVVASIDNFDSATDTVGGSILGFDTGDLAPGAHTLRVAVSGNKNASATDQFLQVDCWDYL